MSSNEPEKNLKQISVIVPAKNEEESIGVLLQALTEQSYSPAEIIITDGGSEDQTREIVRKFADRSPISIVLIEEADAFPGRGRNLAISRSRCEWVACIDAGNVPDKHWLRELVSVAERENNARIIYGRYLPVTDTYFTTCAAIAYLPPPRVFSPFIASTLMQRSVWREAEGFREDLRSGEDLLFFKSINALGIPQARADKAFVHWSLQPSLGATFRRFKTYSRYGMKAGLAREWQIRVTCLYLVLLLIEAAAWFWWPLALLPFVILIMRSQRRIYRWYADQDAKSRAEIFNPRRVLLVTCINVVIDVAMFCGIALWVSRSFAEPGTIEGTTGS
jgi:glycosyltransferase involved in cell wall biosynthesis